MLTSRGEIAVRETEVIRPQQRGRLVDEHQSNPQKKRRALMTRLQVSQISSKNDYIPSPVWMKNTEMLNSCTPCGPTGRLSTAAGLSIRPAASNAASA
jgi:hypothetical protein